MDLSIPAVGIVRGIGPDLFRDLMHASFSAGLDAIELTMNTEGAVETILRLTKEVPAGKRLGMGTIRNIKEAEMAADAGAMFFVTPNFDPDVIRFAVREKIPVIAGAMTPTEVYRAWAEGAAMVKIFPSSSLGPNYIKELKGPFDDIPMMAVGGVNTENMKAWFTAGADAVGVSTALFGKAALESGNIELITENITQFIGHIKKCL